MLLSWGQGGGLNGGAGGPSFVLGFADLGSGAVDTSSQGSSVAPTFTRATAATTVLSTGLIGSVASGSARSYYDPTSLAYLGYLAEGARTNLLLQSEDFATTWSSTDATVTVNNTTSPDGTADADLVTIGSAGTGEVHQDITITADATTAASIWFKAGTAQWVRVILHETANNSNRVQAWFDIQNRVLGTVSAAGTGSAATGRVKLYPNGWVRCEIGGVIGNGATAVRFFIQTVTADANGTTANSVTYFPWGSQWENAVAFASSYIPTTSATVTRNADSLVYPFAVGATGTFFSAGNIPTIGSAVRYLYQADRNADNNNRIEGEIRVAGNSRLGVTDAGVAQAALDTANTISSGVSFKTASAYAANDFAACLNGGAVAVAASGTIPGSLTHIRIGTNTFLPLELFGTISRIAYWPRRIPDSGLQSLTV